MKRNLRTFLFLITMMCSLLVSAQYGPSDYWNVEKIKGTRFISYPIYHGNPFLFDGWQTGTVILNSNTEIGNLMLKYSALTDELIYFNKSARAQIIIDKRSIKSFSLTDNYANTRIFRKQPYTNAIDSERFFEVLYHGQFDVLVFHSAKMLDCKPYKDESGTIKNSHYVAFHNDYLYTPDKGYRSVKPNKSSLLLKFSKNKRKSIKKLLREHGVGIVDQASFIHACELIDREGIIPE